MDHPSSPHRAVLHRNLSRYANRDDLSKLKGARPLIRGQALPYFRSHPTVISPPVSLSRHCNRSHSIIISVVVVVIVVVVAVVVIVVTIVRVARKDHRALVGLGKPLGTTVVLSRGQIPRMMRL